MQYFIQKSLLQKIIDRAIMKSAYFFCWYLIYFLILSSSQRCLILILHTFNSEVQWAQREAFMGMIDKQ